MQGWKVFGTASPNPLGGTGGKDRSMKRLLEVGRDRRILSLNVGPNGMWLHVTDNENSVFIDFEITGYPRDFVEKARQVLSLTANGLYWQIGHPVFPVNGKMIWAEVFHLEVEKVHHDREGFPSDKIKMRLRPEEMRQLLSELEAYWTL